jgi:hypothetical protein
MAHGDDQGAMTLLLGFSGTLPHAPLTWAQAGAPCTPSASPKGESLHNPAPVSLGKAAACCGNLINAARGKEGTRIVQRLIACLSLDSSSLLYTAEPLHATCPVEEQQTGPSYSAEDPKLSPLESRTFV